MRAPRIITVAKVFFVIVLGIFCGLFAATVATWFANGNGVQ
jgi:hypothetical protein